MPGGDHVRHTIIDAGGDHVRRRVVLVLVLALVLHLRPVLGTVRAAALSVRACLCCCHPVSPAVTGTRCSMCANHFFRSGGVCVSCPKDLAAFKQT